MSVDASESSEEVVLFLEGLACDVAFKCSELLSFFVCFLSFFCGKLCDRVFKLPDHLINVDGLEVKTVGRGVLEGNETAEP
jgi:hypothetical protein